MPMYFQELFSFNGKHELFLLHVHKTRSMFMH